MSPRKLAIILACSVVMMNASARAALESIGIESTSNTMTYSSPLKMREELRMGAGLSVGGQLGIWGLNAELNFEDENSAIAGVGVGPGYSSVQFAWKHSFDGDYLSPYFAAGYSRWYSAGGNGDQWKQSSILNRILTAEEKRKGQFGSDFLNLSAGVQYHQLSGSMYGFSVYAELIGMYEIKRSQLIPSGVVGSTYYF